MSVDYMVADEAKLVFGNEEDDDCHIVCCESFDWSPCGRDVSGDDWVADDEETKDCPACDEFDRLDFCGHCALGVGK